MGARAGEDRAGIPEGHQVRRQLADSAMLTAMIAVMLFDVLLTERSGKQKVALSNQSPGG
jgi:hypothetical protein